LDLKGDLDRAIADNNEAIRLKPEYAPAYLARGGSRARTEEIERIMTGGAERPFVRIWHCCRPSAPSITSLSSPLLPVASRQAGQPSSLFVTR
jgi:hypothetical protein